MRDIFTLRCDETQHIVNSHSICALKGGKEHKEDIFRSVLSLRTNQWLQQMEKVVANYQLSHIKVKLEKTLADKRMDNHQLEWQQQQYTSHTHPLTHSSAQKCFLKFKKKKKSKKDTVCSTTSARRY